MSKSSMTIAVQIKDLIHDHTLAKNTFWRHKRTQGVYTDIGVAYDSDREDFVVQYRDPETLAVFSHLIGRFLSTFERVEQVTVWEAIS